MLRTPVYSVTAEYNANLVSPSAQVRSPLPLTPIRPMHSSLQRPPTVSRQPPTTFPHDGTITPAANPTISVEHAALLQHCAKLQAQLQLSSGTVMAEPERPFVKTAVTQHAKRDLFKQIKIIVSDEQLNNTIKDDSIAMFMFRALQIGNERRPSFWKRYRMVVFRAIVDQRSNVMAQMKKTWFGKSIVME